MRPINKLFLAAALTLPAVGTYQVLKPAEMATDPPDRFVAASTEGPAVEPARQQAGEKPATAESDDKPAGVRGFLQRLRSIPKVEMTVQEREAAQRMAALMPELAGADGLFNKGDVEAIIASVRPGLHERVDQEIDRRKADTANQVGSVLPGAQRAVKGLLVDANVAWNRNLYHSRGMATAESIVRNQLLTGLEKSGVTDDTPDPQAHRNLTLAQLEQYGKDGAIIAGYGERARAEGVPKITFPGGLGVDDLEAIQAQRKPPHGRLHLFGE